MPKIQIYIFWRVSEDRLLGTLEKPQSSIKSADVSR